MIRVFGVVTMTTLIVGLSALSLAYVLIDADNAVKYSPYGNTIADDVAFSRAACMLDFGYSGWVCWYHYWKHSDTLSAHKGLLQHSRSEDFR